MTFANIRFLPKHHDIFSDRSGFKLTDPWVETPSVSASSEASSDLSAGSVVDDMLGKKWWSASGGCYVVLSGINDAIDFEEEAGSELAAILNEGVYTASSLAIEAESKMEAAGGANYTVSFDSTTGRWTFSSDLGGLRIFNLLWATGSNAGRTAATLFGFKQHAASEGGGGGSETYTQDLTGASSYISPLVSIHTEEWVKFSFSQAQPISCLGIFGHNLTPWARVSLEANVVDDFSPSARASGIIPLTYNLDFNPDGISLFTQDMTVSERQGKFRYFLIRIQDPENRDLHVEVGRVMGGVYFEPGRNLQFGYRRRRVDPSRKFQTEGTQRLIKKGRQYMIYDLSLELDEADLQALDSLFRQIGGKEPLMISLGDADPAAPPLYGYLSGDWSPMKSFINLYSVDITLEGAV